MVWNTIKAVYGYPVEIKTLENYSDVLDDEGLINWKNLGEKFAKIKPGLNCKPEKILNLDFQPRQENELIQIFPPSMNGDGIAVGRRPIDNSIAGKCANFWAHKDVIDTTYNYSIPEFQHYIGKTGFHHYNLLHSYPCCSDSNGKYVIIGVTFDEIDRNIFLDKKFDEICDKVFNAPTKIENIDDIFFQHDDKSYISPKNCEYGNYNAEIRSKPGVRKHELLSPDHTIKFYVDSFTEHYPFLGKPSCYLMLDDCTFCT